MKEFYVNTLAPKDDLLYIFLKKVSGKKSDGFCLIDNGGVYVIDAGRGEDGEMHRFLLSLREEWLKNAPESVDQEAVKLQIDLIVSHAHPDHIGALPEIVKDPRIAVASVRAPERCLLSKDVPDALEGLKKYEDSLCAIEEQLDVKIRRIPFGKICAVETENPALAMTVYPAPYDWSEDRPNENEGFRHLKKFKSPTYANNPAAGWSNGVMNGNSLWVKIQKGEQTVLITGDQRADEPMLNHMIRYYGEEHFCCDVLKITHHGEKNYPPYLIEVSKAKHFIFTVARDHATPETVELCESKGKAHYLGGGNLLLTLNGEEITETVFE